MKRQRVATGIYRMIIVLLASYNLFTYPGEKSDNFLINVSILILFAILFSSIWRNKYVSYIEWIVLGVLLYFLDGSVYAYALMIVPLSQLMTYKLKFYEIVLMPISMLVISYLNNNEWSITLFLSMTVLLVYLISNDAFSIVDRLEREVNSLKDEIKDLRMRSSRKKNQLSITSKLFFHKKVLEEVDNVKELIKSLVISTKQLFNADAVAFYLFRNGMYFKVFEIDEKKDNPFPDKYTSNQGNKIYYGDDKLELPIRYQKQTWGRITVFNKKTSGEDSATVLKIPFEGRDFETLSMLIETALYRLREIKRSEKLQEAAFYDRLTGIPNRAHLERNAFYLKTKEMKETGKPFHVIMIDIDNFKSFNDTFGHPVGDKVLQTVAKIFTKTIEESPNSEGSNVIGRWGGEEFLGFLSGDKEDVFALAEKIRVNVEQYEFPQRKITVSVGLSTYLIDGTTLEKLVEKADAALYYSKNNGRNQTNFYEAGMEI